MEIKLDSIDGLPEGLGEVVKEVDGAHVLDLSQVVTIGKYQGKDSALSNERAKLEEWTKAFGKDPSAVSAQIDELKSSKPKGKTDDDVAAMIEQATKPLQDKLDASTKQLGALRGKSTSQEISVELAKAGVLPEALDMVANFATSRIVYADDGSMQVRTSDGKPMVGTGENHTATISDLVSDLVKTMPFAVKDGGQGGGGKPPNNGGKPQSKTATRAEFDGMSNFERMKFSKSGGKVVDSA
jgi:hypothetical protein